LALLKWSCDCCANQSERENAAGKKSCDLLFHSMPSIADRTARVLMHINAEPLRHFGFHSRKRRTSEICSGVILGGLETAQDRPPGYTRCSSPWTYCSPSAYGNTKRARCEG
jgi:hypothetical protein